MLSYNKYELVCGMSNEKILGFDCDHFRYLLKYRKTGAVTVVVLKQSICRFKEQQRNFYPLIFRNDRRKKIICISAIDSQIKRELEEKA